MQLAEATENLHLQNNVAMLMTDDLTTRQQQNSEDSTTKLQDAKIQRIKQKASSFLFLF